MQTNWKFETEIMNSKKFISIQLQQLLYRWINCWPSKWLIFVKSLQFANPKLNFSLSLSRCEMHTPVYHSFHRLFVDQFWCFHFYDDFSLHKFALFICAALVALTILWFLLLCVRCEWVCARARVYVISIQIRFFSRRNYSQQPTVDNLFTEVVVFLSVSFRATTTTTTIYGFVPWDLLINK